MAGWAIHGIRLVACAAVLIGWGSATLGQEGKGCLVYRERAFNGEHLPLARNGKLAEMSGTWDNAVSSVRVGPGCLLVAFSEKEFRGVSESFGPGDYPVLPSGWEDEFSSMQCNCL